MRPWIRIAIAGVLGGIAMFFWASLAHLATPLASVGISRIPNEQAVLRPMHTAMGETSGLYLFPWMDGQGGDAMKAYEAKLAAQPSGLLIYHPPGASSLEASQLVTEFASELIQSLIAAALLAWAAISGYWLRVGFVSLIGVAAGITTNISYWNWYGFPSDYTAVYGGIEIVGYVAAGLVIAAVLPRNIPNGLWRVTKTEVSVAIGDMG
jgi:hypothetical protein